MSEWRGVLYWARPVEDVQDAAFQLMFVVYIAKNLETTNGRRLKTKDLTLFQVPIYMTCR